MSNDVPKIFQASHDLKKAPTKFGEIKGFFKLYKNKAGGSWLKFNRK